MKKKLSTDCLPEFNAKNSHGATLVVTTFVSNRSGLIEMAIRIMNVVMAGDTMT